MVDISSQNNKINVTVSSSGNTANTNVTPDYARFYSEKSKEWAISNKIVDNIDNSSKYYANESKKQADISTAKATEVVESGNTALSNIDTAKTGAITNITDLKNTSISDITTTKDNAITSITNQETTSKNVLIDEGATQVGLIQNEGATQVANVQSTGFYMKDDKLYYINSQGEETEFKLDDIELNNPFSLFDSKYSDHELNNLSWLKSEGQWNSGTVYVDAYNELLREYNDSTSVEETEGSITFKRTPKGYKIALKDQETAINTKYATNGIAWYYIIDTVNSQFKLPRTKFGFKGLRTNVGDDIAERLPNIKGDLGRFQAYEFQTKNPFYIHDRDSVNNISGVTTANATGYGMKIGIDASRVSSTYQDGAPVQERATQMYLYFYVGETVQNANIIDAGRIGEQLTNKADIDLNNLSSTGVEKFDGKWIDAGYTAIFLNRALSTSNASIEFLLDFLPDDNVYEVIFNIGITLAYPNNYCYGSVGLSTDIISSSFPACRNSGSAASGNIYTTATIIIPVKNKKIYLSGDSQNRYSTANLIAIAYRKLGTGFEAISQNEGDIR